MLLTFYVNLIKIDILYHNTVLEVHVFWIEGVIHNMIVLFLYYIFSGVIDVYFYKIGQT